jgi:predicted unusual protein kinase regulating ubiquinone biosynthesis (AarF/ABC1/UbiB family)
MVIMKKYIILSSLFCLMNCVQVSCQDDTPLIDTTFFLPFNQREKEIQKLEEQIAKQDQKILAIGRYKQLCIDGIFENESALRSQGINIEEGLTNPDELVKTLKNPEQLLETMYKFIEASQKKENFQNSPAVRSGVQIFEETACILQNTIQIQKKMTFIELHKKNLIAQKHSLVQQNSRQNIHQCRSQAYVTSFSPADLLLPPPLRKSAK